MGLLILTKALFIGTTVFFASCFMYNYVQFLKRGYGEPDSSPGTMTGYSVRYTNNFVFTIMEIIASGLFYNWNNPITSSKLLGFSNIWDIISIIMVLIPVIFTVITIIAAILSESHD
jgi:preprotein translocase subunit SecG